MHKLYSHVRYLVEAQPLRELFYLINDGSLPTQSMHRSSTITMLSHTIVLLALGLHVKSKWYLARPTVQTKFPNAVAMHRINKKQKQNKTDKAIISSASLRALRWSQSTCAYVVFSIPWCCRRGGRPRGKTAA